ncbi:peptidoglycan DD-metalloendopeptidase family protein [Psychroserpens sp. MEBiC05023]
MSKALFDALKGVAPFHVLDASILVSDYISLDLSNSNNELKTVDVFSSEKLGQYINLYINKHKAKVGFGGYLETRNIYNRSDYFNDNSLETKRNIHLGLDLWISAETPIYAPLDGVVHSFKNNINFGDYGPTIILKHSIEGIEFYTLYGHLSLVSIKNLKVGQGFKKGDQIATLGDAKVNGDYPPHLHFQIIKDMQGFIGDYPGVCSKRDLQFYKDNCPDPNVLLHLK